MSIKVLFKSFAAEDQCIENEISVIMRNITTGRIIE